MSPCRLGLPLLVLACCTSIRPAAGQASASQQVTIIVEEISALSVSAAEATLVLSTASAGSGLAAATDNATTYSLTTNGSGKKITAQLDADYASGIRLEVLLAPPGAGSATTQQTLSTTPQALVTGIGNAAVSGLSITYTAFASDDAAPNDGTGGETHTVTYTVTD